MTTPSDQELRSLLNSETAKIAWSELERHFARGVLVRVSSELDLVDVAVRFTQDDKHAVQSWLRRGLVAKPSDNDAKRWSERQATFWAVVTAPWVLVQEITTH